ncbi:hypothetical protein UCD39_13150 [Nitrospirillum sp. BR 11752]|uniref:hypothetical protein n=1 Tax=Nitrospirillum sp. BR 11752 TaxID=3104293 RepID=UPI002EB51253|nr:hypothetical protein [Nitrospirillum sp. BR 11752]
MSRAETMSLKMLVSLAVILTATSAIMDISHRCDTLSIIADAGCFLFAASFYFAFRNKLSDQTARVLGLIYLMICAAGGAGIAGTLFGF